MTRDVFCTYENVDNRAETIQKPTVAHYGVTGFHINIHTCTNTLTQTQAHLFCKQRAAFTSQASRDKEKLLPDSFRYTANMQTACDGR